MPVDINWKDILREIWDFLLRMLILKEQNPNCARWENYLAQSIVCLPSFLHRTAAPCCIDGVLHTPSVMIDLNRLDEPKSCSTFPVADEGQKHCCASDRLWPSLAASILKEEEALPVSQSIKNGLTRHFKDV